MSSKRKLRQLRRLELQKARLELDEIRGSLGKAYECFNTASDPDLTVASIFEINSLRARYDYTLRGIKTNYSDSH